MKTQAAPAERSAPALPPLAGPLLLWYDGHARVLPWREEPTPYRVWISEVMLQQTRVEAVKPYFDRFLAALPDVEALAAAPEEQLLKLWEGLGYYNRARNLQRAARIVLERDGGRLPASVALLRSLPGVGGYTAGAIASIAYGLPAAAVDGNVLRVTARLTDFSGDTTNPKIRRGIAAEIEAQMPPMRAGEFNQALMELGATVCLPNGAPRCEECPLESLCLAKARGTALLRPVKQPKKPRRIEDKTVLVIVSEGEKERLRLEKRPQKGLLAGMWQFPLLDGHWDAQAVQARLESEGAQVLSIAPLPKSRHIFTHVEWQMQAFLIRCAAPFAAETGRWAAADERERYALPSAFSAYEGLFSQKGETAQRFRQESLFEEEEE